MYVLRLRASLAPPLPGEASGPAVSEPSHSHHVAVLVLQVVLLHQVIDPRPMGGPGLVNRVVQHARHLDCGEVYCVFFMDAFSSLCLMIM